LKKYFASYWIRSAFYVFLQRFSLTIFGLINFMVLIRSFSTSEMGTYALFLIVTTIFETTKSALLKNAHIRYVSAGGESPEKSAIASSSLLINGMLTLVFIIFILLFAHWLSATLHAGDALSGMLHWFIPGMACMVLFSHFEAIQQSHFDFKGVFAGHLVRQVSFFIFIFLHFIRKSPLSLDYVALYQGISILTGTVVLYLYSRKYLLHRFDPTLAWVKKIIGYGGYIFGSGIISTVFSNLDQIMTAKFMSVSSVAYYNAGTRLNNFIDVPSYAAGEILFPKMSRASAEEGIDKVKYFYERMVSILLSIIIPVAIVILLFPKLIIFLIAGSQYAKSAPILQLYILASIMGPMQNQAANTLNSMGKTALCFTLNSISLATKLVITYICMAGLGFYGAAIGTLITAALNGVFWYYMMRRQIGASLPSVIRYIGEFYRNAWTNGLKIISRARKTRLI
jgi:lipopolysaccharide exporter